VRFTSLLRKLYLSWVFNWKFRFVSSALWNFRRKKRRRRQTTRSLTTTQTTFSIKRISTRAEVAPSDFGRKVWPKFSDIKGDKNVHRLLWSQDFISAKTPHRTYLYLRRWIFIYSNRVAELSVPNNRLTFASCSLSSCDMIFFLLYRIFNFVPLY